MKTFGQFAEETTAEIEQWLGGSVIRTPVFHGTNKNFKEFKQQKSQRFVLFTAFDVESQGFFFTEDYETAKIYGKNIITAYVRMMNPVLDPRTQKHLGVDKLPERLEAKIAFILRKATIKHKEYGRRIEIGVGSHPVPDRTRGDFPSPIRRKRMFADYDWIYNAIGSGGLHWDVLDKPEVVNSMKALGFDGTFVHEDHDGTGRSLFVPNSNQIFIVGTE